MVGLGSTGGPAWGSCILWTLASPSSSPPLPPHNHDRCCLGSKFYHWLDERPFSRIMSWWPFGLWVIYVSSEWLGRLFSQPQHAMSLEMVVWRIDGVRLFQKVRMTVAGAGTNGFVPEPMALLVFSSHSLKLSATPHYPTRWPPLRKQYKWLSALPHHCSHFTASRSVSAKVRETIFFETLWCSTKFFSCQPPQNFTLSSSLQVEPIVHFFESLQKTKWKQRARFFDFCTFLRKTPDLYIHLCPISEAARWISIQTRRRNAWSSGLPGVPPIFILIQLQLTHYPQFIAMPTTFLHDFFEYRLPWFILPTPSCLALFGVTYCFGVPAKKISKAEGANRNFFQLEPGGRLFWLFLEGELTSLVNLECVSANSFKYKKCSLDVFAQNYSKASLGSHSFSAAAVSLSLGSIPLCQATSGWSISVLMNHLFRLKRWGGREE